MWNFKVTQGKSEGFNSCDRPNNLSQILFKSSIFWPVWPWNMMHDLEKQWGHRWIQTELQSRNAQIRVKICDFFPVWPLKLMDDFEKQQGTSSMKLPWPSGQFTGLPHGRSWVCPWCPARGVIPHGCSPYHTSMAVGKGLGRLVHISSRCWEATCGWG